MAPSPPRTGSNVVPIVLLSLALIVLVCVMAVWASLRFIAHEVRISVNDEDAARKAVSIKTPFGAIQVNKNGAVSEAALGLPVYPGATRMRDQDSASVILGLPGDAGLNLTVAKYRTPDAIEKVKAFYQDRIGKEVTKFRERDREGKTVFEIKVGDDVKVVALKGEFEGTRIDLVHVSARGGEAD
jgi:hypothetical protein